MNLKKIFFFCLLITANFLAVASDSTCVVNNLSFQPGESLTFKISYNWHSIWIGAGEANVSVLNGTYDNKPCYHIVGSGATYRTYDWFYQVHDKYETYVDPNTMLPLRFVRTVDEGGTKFYQNVLFYQAQNKATSLKGTYVIPSCIQDVLSVYYYLRNIDMSKYNVNDKIPVTIFLDDKVYPLYARYLGKETITTSLGTFRCLKFRPLVVAGTIFKGGEDMIIWVSDDANRIPIKVESPIVVGNVSAELIKSSGLRNPFSSKIN
jgi:hypothetical protein